MILLRPNLSYIRSIRVISWRRNHRSVVLGIETSCDDTGCAVVHSDRKLLGDSLFSQNDVHVRYGGINPIFARDLHRDNIELAVNEALQKAQQPIHNISAIAVTVKPGLLISLEIGVKYARYLSKKHRIPLIPIHHMEAHALVARMYTPIPFPFLVLLISGGHCLLAVAKGVKDFLLLGEATDNAPGEILDKVARRMKLRNIPLYSKLAGGRAIEIAASKSKYPDMFKFPIPLLKYRDCNFSFSGLKDSVETKLISKEKEHGIIADGVIPEINDLCAGFQLAVAEHIAHRTERAIKFCEECNLLDGKHNIVVSGGVACNNFIFNCIKAIGNRRGYSVIRPPSQLCTDNGIMIAWNGIEKLKENEDLQENINMNEIQAGSPLGKSLINDVISASIPLKATRLRELLDVK